MSSGHFSVILTLLTCRDSKGRSPLASLGTAQRLAPVQSGLPLCETCPVISPPLSQPLLISFLLHAIPNFDRDDSGFVVQKQTVEEIEKLPFPQIFSSRSGLIMHHSDAKYRTIMYRIRHSVFSLFHAYKTSPIHQRISVIVPCYFCFFRLGHFLILLKDIKITVINISPILISRNAITAIIFFFYFVFTKLLRTVSLFSCYCHFVIC